MDCETGENPGLSPCTAGLCRKVRGADCRPLQCSVGAPEMHGPFNASQWGWHCRSFALGTHRQGMQNLPHQNEEAALLGEEFELPEAPDDAAFLPECPETPQPVEPNEWINALSTPAPSSPTPKPCHHPSWKTKKSWWGTEADPSFTTEWIQSLVEKNERVPGLWREFQSIICSKDELFNAVQVKELACWQATAFRLPATQMEKDGRWTAPSFLGVLQQKDYLPLKELQGVWDHWVVWREEMVVLAIALQRCIVWSWMSPGVLCRAVQEVHRWLTPLGEQSDPLDLIMLDMAKKDSITPPVPTKGASSSEPRVEEPIGLPAPDEPPTL